MGISSESNEGVIFGMVLGGGVVGLIFTFVLMNGQWYQTTTYDAISECAAFCERNEGVDYIKVGDDRDGCHCKNGGMLIVEKD